MNCHNVDSLRKGWLGLDKMLYAMGEDQVMYYKMYLQGKRQLTSYNSGIVHMDAGSTMQSLDKENSRICADLRFKLLFWHRFIYRVTTVPLKWTNRSLN